MIKTILILCLFIASCNVDHDGNHVRIIKPKSTFIKGSSIDVIIDKCGHNIKCWKMVINDQVIIDDKFCQISFPFRYKWKLPYEGKHIINVSVTDTNNIIQHQNLIVQNEFYK